MADVRSGLDPKDYKYLVDTPDPGFSPERNKAIVEETIREATKYLTDYSKILNEDGQYRKDILKSYAVYTLSKGGSHDLKTYLGRQKYEELIGDRLLSKVKVAQTEKLLRKG